MSSKGSILIIDDNDQNLNVMGNILSFADYDFAMEMTGPDGIRFATENQPDLILLDIMMPGMNGYEVCKILKENPNTKNIPVIFLTAKNDINDLVKGFELGGVDYIVKPIRREELLLRISTQIELHRTKQYLQDANETKDLLFSIISHDLRGSIGNISSWLKVLNDSETEIGKAELKSVLESLNVSAEGVTNLLENLLDWSRDQRNAINVYPEIQPVLPLINETIYFLSGILKKKNIFIEINSDENHKAYFDKDTIITVIRNLISNAIKFSKQNSEIKIYTAQDEKELMVTIQDFGTGINIEKIGKIFQGNSIYSTKGTTGEKGTGLGLVLCKTFVLKNKGKIWVESKENDGTRFIFTLPGK